MCLFKLTADKSHFNDWMIRNFDKLSAAQCSPTVGRNDADYLLYCISVSGKIVLLEELVQNSFGQFGIEMSALPKGFYFVEFSGERINRVVQVVKE